jgi:class 3 adenylate cyclase/CHASE2 domain-containing sensor protein
MCVVGLVALASGALDGLNNYGLDLHLRHVGGVEADPRIVMVDINDHAIETVGEWPWPRRRYAQLVNVLNELGAGAIVLDFVLSDPTAPRVEHAGLDSDYDIATDLAPIGDPAEDAMIYDDDELRDAIATAGNVYLAMFFRASPPGVDPGAIVLGGVRLIKEDAGISAATFADRLRGRFPGAERVFEIGALYDSLRIVCALQDEYGVDARSLTDGTGRHSPIDMELVETHLPDAKRLVARELARSFLAEHPEGTWTAFYEQTLPAAARDTITPDRRELLEAFRFGRSFRLLSNASPPIPAGMVGRVQHGYDHTLPLSKFARDAKGVGFVSFPREKSGGVVREIPLIGQVDGGLVFQLGFLVALDELQVEASEIGFSAGALTLGTGPDARRIPIANDGTTLLRWHVPEEPERWQSSFHHIPVARVLEVAMNREAIRENETRLGLAMAELVELRYAEAHAGYAEYVRLINERRTLEGGVTDAEEPDGRRVAKEALRTCNAAIADVERDAVAWLRRVHGLWQSTEPINEAERAERDQIQRLWDRFGEGRLGATLAELNARMGARTNLLLQELQPKLEGKLCFVGYTASGVADLVTSPVYSSMPGVMAHANVTNMVLQDEPLRRVARWVNALLMLVVGLGVVPICTGLGARRSAAVSLVGLVVVAIVVFLMGWLMFSAFGRYVGSAGVIAQLCVSWTAVTAYRQATEERSRRQFQRALGQYTSPAVASQIANRADRNDFAPGPATVTCYFSDLRSFTELSERLGAERTRSLLNPYLERMSRVLVEHGALVNKFMGDGIFAFFNAPIWPCSNHAERSCACAIASVAALSELNRATLASGRDRERGEPLAMRIGLATGEAFVGDYGSDTKLDYTCIGDTVNLASRLEGACKVLGTTILTDEATRRQAGERFTFRSLGRIVLPGKRAATEVYELLGLHDDSDAAGREYATSFAEVVRRFQHCEWDDCLVQIERCRRARDDDAALGVYAEAAARFRDQPPPQDWDGTIRLALA